ncbi:hypothetical protein ACFSCX_16280 [Bacillus salitolerans]|uniref:Uncharacterized protein n=1 Tax=Bacillus salitolerans TaxID=1437434 RepID=A0ABW4LSQ3_9BACI
MQKTEFLDRRPKNAIQLFEQFMGISSDGVVDNGLFYELTNKLHIISMW